MMYVFKDGNGDIIQKPEASKNDTKTQTRAPTNTATYEANKQKALDNDARFRAFISTKDVLIQILDRYGVKYSNSKSFLCFAHNDHNPSARITYSERDNMYQVSCFTCGRGFNVFQILMYFEGITYKEAYIRLKKEYGYFCDDFRSIDTNKHHREPFPVSAPKQPKEEKPTTYEHNRSKLIKCFNRLMQTHDYEKPMKHFLDRCIDRKTLKAYGVGYAPEGLKEIEAKEKHYYKYYKYIYPCNNGRYVAEPYDRTLKYNGQERIKYQKPTENGIFGYKHLLNGHFSVVYVCEGVFDAMSIYQTGVDAIALIGLYSKPLEDMYKLLTDAERELMRRKIYIIMLDNDDKKERNSGQEAVAKVMQWFKDKNLIVYTDILKYKDANEALCKDRQYFFSHVYEKALDFYVSQTVANKNAHHSEQFGLDADVLQSDIDAQSTRLDNAMQYHLIDVSDAIQRVTERYKDVFMQESNATLQSSLYDV